MNDSFELIYSDLNIEVKPDHNEVDLLALITDRVAWLLENDKDLLLSYLYRLDIDEQKIDKALSPTDDDPASLAIARLIFERQKQRLATKIKYKVNPIEGWEF